MLIKSLASFALAIIAGSGLTLTAHANPQFTVENNLNQTVNVAITDGDDAGCKGKHGKMKSLRPGETNSFGCHGNGTKRCKIALWVDHGAICERLYNTCDKGAIKVKSGKTVTINSKTNCEIH